MSGFTSRLCTSIAWLAVIAANSYAYSARAAAVCGIDGGFPRAAEAVEWLEDNLPDYRSKMAQNPVWAIVPGGAAAK